MSKLIGKSVIIVSLVASLVLMCVCLANAQETKCNENRCVTEELSEVFPWLCEEVQLRTEGEEESVWFKVIDSKKVYRGFAVGVPGAEEVTRPDGSIFLRQKSDLRSYVSKKLFITQLLVDSKTVRVLNELDEERTVNDLKNQLAAGKPVFLMFGDNALAAEFKKLVKKNYFLVRIHPPAKSHAVSIQSTTTPHISGSEPRLDLFGVPTHQQKGKAK